MPVTVDVNVILDAVLLHIVCVNVDGITSGIGFTVIMISFDVAGEPVVHVAVEVSSHLTLSLFNNVEVV